MESTTAPTVTRRVAGDMDTTDISAVLDDINEAFAAIQRDTGLGMDLSIDYEFGEFVAYARVETARKTVSVSVRYEFNTFASTDGMRSESNFFRAKDKQYPKTKESYTSRSGFGQGVDAADVYDLIDNDLAAVFAKAMEVRGQDVIAE